MLYVSEQRKFRAKVLDAEMRQQYQIPETTDLKEEQVADLKKQLHRAVYFGHVDIVCKILKIIPIDSTEDAGLLFTAVVAERNSSELVKILMNKGLKDVNQRDENGETMLHAAAYYGHHEAAKVLIENGAIVNVIDIDRKAGPSFHQTPLHVSAQYGTWEVAKILLENGADINAKNRSGFTPLDVALWKADPDHESASGKRNVARLIRQYMEMRITRNN